jgi:Predicted oxidoreductases (related to aryl-alcohol dehydrogenases)
MMQKRSLGRTGLQVSELSLGTLNFGWRTDESASMAILDAFHAAGGNFLQATAISPAPALPSVSTRFTEDVIGRWWTSRAIPRGDLVLSTRIDVRRPGGRGERLSTLMGAKARESMRRLHTDYLDLLVIEWSDDLLPSTELLEAFDALVRTHDVRYVAAANFPAWRVADCVSRAFHRNGCRMEALQGDYSLMIRTRFEPEAMSLCDEFRLGFIATSPLAGGFLARRARGLSGRLDGREWVHQRFNNHYGDAALDAIEAVANRQGARPVQVALAWVLANPHVTSALVGVRSVAELKELVQASELALGDEDREELARATAAEEVVIPTRMPLGRGVLMEGLSG